MSGPDWNPSTPSKRGIELQDVGYGHSLVDSASAAAWAEYVAQSSLTVGQMDAYTGSGASAPLLTTRYNELGRPMLLEVVAPGDELPDDVVINDYSPTSITGIATGMVNENGTAIAVNRLTGLNDGLYIKSNILGASFEVNFGTGAYDLGRHVLAVEIYAAINLTMGVRRIDIVGGTSPWSYNIPMWTSGNQLVSVRMGEVLADGTDTAWTWWTPQKIRDFATAASRRIRISCQAGPGYWRIDRLFMRVYSVTERRVGVGVGVPSTSLAWTEFPMLEPDESGAMPQTNGDTYRVLMRRPSDYSIDNVSSAVLPWRYLTGYDPGGRYGRLEGLYPALTPGASSRPLVLDPEEVQGLPSLRLWNSALTQVRGESQPYELSRGSEIHTTEETDQVLDVLGSTSYGQVYAVVGWRPQTGRPTGPLVAEVLTEPGGVTVLGPAELTAAEVEALPTTAPVNATDPEGVQYKLAVFRFASSATLAAGTYRVTLSSPESTSTRPWWVAALLGEDHSPDRSYGGSVEFAEGDVRIMGLHQDLADYSADVLVNLVTVPAPVTGVSAEPDVVDLAGTAMVCGPNCALHDTLPEYMPVVRLAWSAAPSGTPDVASYDVDRLNTLTDEWERVAAVQGRTTTSWVDHEAPVGVEVFYRVRVVRTDEVTGDWSATAAAFIDPPDLVGLYLSSNAATGMGVAYPEVWGGDTAEREWEFEEYGDVSLQRFYARNRPVAFRPIERAGDSFVRELLVASGCAVASPTMRIWKPLRDLTWAPVPYVCIRDTEGNVWRAAVMAGPGTNSRADSNGAEVWTVRVRCVEVADTAAVHDTSVAQVTRPLEV